MNMKEKKRKIKFKHATTYTPKIKRQSLPKWRTKKKKKNQIK